MTAEFNWDASIREYFLLKQNSETWSEYFDVMANLSFDDDLLDQIDRHGIKALEPFFAADRISAVAKAKMGDRSELADLVESRSLLNADESQLIADILRGKAQPIRNRPTNHRLTLEVSCAFFWLHTVDGIPRKNAISDCVEQFHLSKTSIEDRLKAGKKCPMTKEKLRLYQFVLSLGHSEIMRTARQLDLKPR